MTGKLGVSGAFGGQCGHGNVLLLSPAYHGYFDIFSDTDSLILWKVLYDRGGDPTDEVSGSRRIFYEPGDTLTIEVMGLYTYNLPDDGGDLVLKQYRITLEKLDKPLKGEFHTGWTIDSPVSLPGMCIQSLQHVQGGLLGGLLISRFQC